MKTVIQNDLNSSSYDFTRLVWPSIKNWCGGGRYVEMEDGKEEGAALALDAIAGIDGLQVLPEDMGIRGIASRIQWGPKNWDTFTVREGRSNNCTTELAKRSYAIATPGCFVPYFTVQAYISQRKIGSLLSVALAYTHELIPYAYTKGIRRYLNQSDGQTITFLAVDWWKYAQAGNFIKFITGGCEYYSIEEEDALVPAV